MNRVLEEHETDHKETAWDIMRMARLIETENFDDIQVEGLSPELNRSLQNAFRRMDTLAQVCLC